MRIILSFLLGAIFVSVLAVSSRAAEKTDNPKWPTTDFEIDWELFKSTEAADQFIKTSLSEIAKYYENQGLRQPFLPFEDEKYIVQARADVESSEYQMCGTDTPRLTIKVTKLLNNLENSSIQEMDKDFLRKSYNDLAHELFHAIQGGYDYEYDSIRYCQQGAGFFAVTEGTATAAASLATKAKFPEYLKSLDLNYSSIGAFPYEQKEFLKAEHDENQLDYKTASFWMYLAERFGGKTPLVVFDVMFKEELPEAALKARYRWLDDSIQKEKIAGKPLYIVFPDFHAEFASYVEDRYNGDRDDWTGLIHRLYGSKCRTVELKPDSFYGEVKINSTDGTVARNGATCIELKWQGTETDDEIQVEAVHSDLYVIDRLHLGVSYLKAGKGADSCFEKITVPATAGSRKRRAEHFECSLGKLFVKKDKTKVYKPWILGSEAANKKGDFFGGDLGSGGRAFLVLTNMGDKPETGAKIPADENDELVVKFSIYRTSKINGRRYRPVDLVQLRDTFEYMPGPAFAAYFESGAVQSTASKYSWTGQRAAFIEAVYSPKILNQAQQIDRYSVYGIKKPSPVLQSGIGSTFQTVSVADPKKKYSILPVSAQEFRFGYLGPFSGIVSNQDNALSSLCKENAGKPIGEITKSDDEQLRFNVSADLCKMMPNGQIQKVDTVIAEFIYPFGRRAFPETAPQDVITPGLELYIDEYLKELARRGLQFPATVLLSDGTHPNGNGPDPNPDDPTDNPDEKKTNSDSNSCDCSCKAFARIKKLGEEAKKDPAKRKEMMASLACLQTCAPKFAKCNK